MGAAYDLLKVIEDGTLNDEFEGLKFWEGIMPLTQIMFILLSSFSRHKNDRTLCSLESKVDIDFDIARSRR